jgi:hypothetical protein
MRTLLTQIVALQPSHLALTYLESISKSDIADLPAEHSDGVRAGRCVATIEGVRRGEIEGRESDGPSNNAGLGIALSSE